MAEDRWTLKNPERVNEVVKKLFGSETHDLIEGREFLREFFSKCGGAKKAAQEIAGVFIDKETTNDTKRRIMEGIFGMMKFVEQRSGPPADLSTASEGELMAIVKESMNRAA